MVKRVVVVVALIAAVAGTSAGAAPLPGVKTPTRNISCFYVPIKPTARGNTRRTRRRKVSRSIFAMRSAYRATSSGRFFTAATENKWVAAF